MDKHENRDNECYNKGYCTFSIKHSKKRGNVYVGTIIGLFVFLSIFILMIMQLKQIVIKYDLYSVARMAILRIETDGGVTSDTRQKIINGLDFEGYDPSKLTIDPAEDVTNATKAAYGEKVNIDLSYDYVHEEYEFSGFNIVSVLVTDTIKAHLATTSKNAR